MGKQGVAELLCPAFGNRWVAERQQAQLERQRAEAEQQRANDAERRAQRLAEQLRALGIEPGV